MRPVAALIVALLAAPLASAQSLSGPFVGGYLGGGSADAHWDVSTGNKVDHSLNGGIDLRREEHVLQGTTNKVDLKGDFVHIGVHYKF